MPQVHCISCGIIITRYFTIKHARCFECKRKYNRIKNLEYMRQRKAKRANMKVN